MFVVQAGYNVLLSDCDVVFLDNPFSTLISAQHQVTCKMRNGKIAQPF
jgi:hypothetical protein